MPKPTTKPYEMPTGIKVTVKNKNGQVIAELLVHTKDYLAARDLRDNGSIESIVFC